MVIPVNAGETKALISTNFLLNGWWAKLMNQSHEVGINTGSIGRTFPFV